MPISALVRIQKPNGKGRMLDRSTGAMRKVNVELSQEDIPSAMYVRGTRDKCVLLCSTLDG